MNKPHHTSLLGVYIKCYTPDKVIEKYERCDKNTFQVNHRKFSLKWSLWFKLFFLLSSLFILPAQAETNCAEQTDIPKIECEALLKLYQSMNRTGWTKKNGWNADNKPCKWYGITCTEGRVKQISLASNNLNGTLPDELDNLSTLQYLSLRDNRLSGPLPAWKNMSTLQYLYLSNNQLSGPLPAWKNMNALQYLSLRDNQLSGFLQAWDHMISLQSIDLSSNQLIGVLPAWNNMSALQDLYLYNNQLSGPLPAWENMNALQILWLSNNQLSGPLLAWNNMSALQVLYLNNNQLSGSLPAWNNMTALQELDLSTNQLNGLLPTWKDMSALQVLNLSGNQLSGYFPTWENMNALQSIDLSNNKLSGPLPAWKNMRALQWLDLNNNQLSGHLPSEWSNLKKLRYLSLFNNQLSGPLPPAWSELSALQELYLNDNHLSGTLPAKWSEMSALQELYLNDNQLIGDIPSAFTQLMQLFSFEIRHNMLTATNPQVTNFVSQYNPDWQNYQTVPPNNFTARVDDDQIQLNWTPILYQEDGGYYEVGYSEHAGGPYTVEPVNGDKTTSTYTMTHLPPTIPYYFVVRTHTSAPNNSPDNAWTSNAWTSNTWTSNAWISPWSEEIQIETTENCTIQTDIPKIECEALFALYQSTNGANWTNKNGWNTDNEPCKWYGITCTAGRVTEISLYGNNLSGTLPNELDNLSALQSLYLYNNQLSGPLPAWNHMSALQDLRLSDNQLNGSLPAWNHMSALQSLNLSHNQLNGSLPAWSNMNALQSLNLSHNQLNGSLPAWNHMSALQSLNLSHNQLNGSLPAWNHMSALQSLNLSHNQLSDNLPEEWEDHMSALQSLNLSNNQLIGDLPEAWNHMSALQELDLSTNKLSNDLPEAWNHMSALQSLNLSHNQLIGDLPEAWNHMSALQELNLSNNKLNDNLPEEWGNMSALQSLNLSHNQLNGSLQAWNHMSALQSLNLSNNQLSNDLPEEWNHMSALQELNLSTNKLSGDLPEEWNTMSALQKLDLSNNKLSDHLPEEWGNMSALQSLNLSTNKLSGDLPEEWNHMSALQELNLSTNKLSGDLPEEWNNMSALQKLNISTNKLSGDLPEEWNHMSALQSLDLSNNQLSNDLPEEWNHMSALVELKLYVNKLSGPLPVWNNMKALQWLDLNNNQLIGHLPSEWSNLKALRYLSLFNNQLSGPLPPAWSEMNALKILYLSDNHLSGSLPVNWSKMSALENFMLYNNQLSGDIPSDFIQMKLLSLSIRYNMLTADPIVTNFVNKYDPDWQNYQTVPPNNLTAIVNDDQIQLNWSPILYQEDGGYYEVGYSEHAGGPYTVEPVGGDKIASTYTVTHLSSATFAYFVVHTYTSVPGNYQNNGWTQNDWISLWSEEIQVIPPTQMFSLTVTVSGHGSITSLGIQCGTDCDENYAKGISVTLQAKPDSDYLFTGWNGNCQDLPNPATLIIDQAKTCSANFEALTFPLTVHKIGTGEGTLTSNPEGIHCDDDECTQSYLANTQVTLTANPSTNSKFIQWGGDCSPLPAPSLTAQVLLDQAKTCTATFEKTFSFNIAPTPLNGLIESGTLDEEGLFLADGQIQCGTNHSLCTKNVLMNTQVTLQAKPDSDYLFTGWNGDCQDLPNPATLSIDQAKTCSANFMSPASTITLAVEVERISGGEGFVSGTLIDEQNKPKGSPIIDCGKDCDENLPNLSQAQKIRLTAVPDSTARLTQWTCNGQVLSKRENLLTLQQDLNCATRFEKDQDTSPLTLSKMGQGRIAAKRQGEIATELSCTSAGTCQVTKNFSLGREVKVTTTPDAGFMTRWVSGSCRPDPKHPNRATLPANLEERSCHVEFVRDERIGTVELSIQTNGEGVVTGNIQGSAYGQLYCEGQEPCKHFYLPGTVVRLNAIPGPFSVFKGWQGCQTASSSSLLVTLPQSGEHSCTAVFGERSEKTVEKFCKRIGEGGGYMMQGTQKIPVSNTFQCTSASNQARLQEAFRLAYPVKMMMELHQLVTQTWPDHFPSHVPSWYRQYPPEIKNIRAMTAGHVEIQLNLKDEHDVEQRTTISYGTAPTGEAGTILFKRKEEQFQKLYDLAGEVRRNFAQKLNNNAQVMALYQETENQTRLKNAFWLALPALMTAEEENLRLENVWPESFNGVSWYDPQPPWKVAQARGNHTRGFKGMKFLADHSLEIQLVVLNNNHQEEEVSVLVYYGDPPHGGILYPRGKE